MSYNSLFGLGSHSPDAKLMRFWPELDPSGSTIDTIAADAVTWSNSPVVGSKPNPWTTNSVLLDGVNQRGDRGGNLLATGNGVWSASCWVKCSDQNGYILGNSINEGGFDIYYWQWRVAEQDVSCRAYRGTQGRQSAPSLDDGNWHHLLMRGDTWPTCEMWLDGVQIASSISIAGNGKLRFRYIGGWSESNVTTGYFKGEIAEVSLWDKNLSASEIAEAYAGPEPLNLTLPIMAIDAAGFYSGTVGTWDNQSNGTMSYDYEVRRVSDDVPVASESGIAGPNFGGQVAGFTNDPAGYYVWVRGINDGGFDTAEDTTSYLGTLGNGLLHWYDASITGDATDLAGTADATMQGSMTVVVESTGPGNGGQAFRSDAATDVAVAVPADIVRPVTMTGWVMVEDQRDNVPLEIVDTDLVDNYARIYLRNANTTRLLVNHGGGNGIVNGSQYTSGQWGFYAFSLPEPAGSTPILFQDGETYTSSFTRTVDNFNEINFGATTNGYTDSVRVYDRELTTEELTTLYKAGRGYDHNSDKPSIFSSLPGCINRWCPTLSSIVNDTTVDDIASNENTLLPYIDTNNSVVTDTDLGGTLTMEARQQNGTSGFYSTKTRTEFSGDYSTSFWYKPFTPTQNGQTVGSLGSAGGNTQGMRWYINPGGDDVYWTIHDPSQRQFGALELGIATWDTFTHIACVNDTAKDERQIWINGQLGATATPAGGTIPGGVDWPVQHSRIDDFCVFNRALSSAEVVELFDGKRGYQPGGVTPSRTFHPLIQG